MTTKKNFRNYWEVSFRAGGVGRFMRSESGMAVDNESVGPEDAESDLGTASTPELLKNLILLRFCDARRPLAASNT